MYIKMYEKYKKKCKRVKELLIYVKNLKKEIEIINERRESAWENVHMLKIVVDSLENNFYKIKFKAKNSKGLITEFEETILSRHAILAKYVIKNRGYDEYEFISIEKTT
jgi:hypothetical protein